MSEALFKKKLVQNIIRATNMTDAKSPPPAVGGGELEI